MEVKCKLTGSVMECSEEQAELLVSSGSFERIAKEEPKKAPRRKAAQKEA